MDGSIAERTIENAQTLSHFQNCRLDATFSWNWKCLLHGRQPFSLLGDSYRLGSIASV